MNSQLHTYIEQFNRNDEELYGQLIPNKDAEAFLLTQIPLIDCPDPELENIYYFRWWTYRKHIKATEKGHIITEFLPPVRWSGPYNSINCPACFHIREGRWLRDSDGWIKEYINFWLDGIGDAYRYSCWLAHAVLEYCTLKNDLDFAKEKLPQLVEFFETRESTHRRAGGIYWSNDNLDGMEYSISGPGLRPTINSYAYGDALAIAKIAKLSGRTEIQLRFEKKAHEIKKSVDTLLWDQDFYKTIPLPEEQDVVFTERPSVDIAHDVRELAGYIPWYFNLPDEGKDSVFMELLDDKGFYAPFGLTTAEQRHPRFMEEHSHECLWNGPVWPFATSQVLVAMSNLLHNYSQSSIRKEDYYKLLLQYAKSHRLTREDCSKVPWIDEDLHPYNGRWIARDRLKEWGWLPGKGGRERGKDYNHSLFCDLILSGLFGINVENGTFVASPLIPDSWDYFRVENLWLDGRQYRIFYDRDGTHYGLGKGLCIQKIS